jgi:DNA-directed RNA polymerase alpha subunit
MTSDFKISLQRLKEILDGLTENESRFVINYLRHKLEKLSNEELIETVIEKTREGNFLDTPIDEFNLAPRTKNELKINHIKTVKDLIEFGLNNLGKLPRIASGTIAEIRKVVFLDELEYLVL